MARVLPVLSPLSVLLLALLFAVASLPAAARGGRLDDVPRPSYAGRGMPTYPPPPPPPPQPLPPPAAAGEPTPPPVTFVPSVRPRSYADWTWWYATNRERFERIKPALYRFGSNRPVLDAETDEGIAPHIRRIQESVGSEVLPALRRALASGPRDVRAAAYIALGKVAREPAHVAWLRDGLRRKADADPLVQEAAAIGLGLLRRRLAHDQLPASELDAVRALLFSVVEDDGRPARTRALAAVSLGLLGDQPTGSTEDEELARAAARATTSHLFELPARWDEHQDVALGLLLAIGMQPADSVTDEERVLLADAIRKGRLNKTNLYNQPRAYAAHALGRVGTRKDIDALQTVLATRRGVSHDVRRSAAIALGVLGRRLDGEARVEIARALLGRYDRLKDVSTRAFAVLSLAELLAADVRDGVTSVRDETKADELLLETASRGRIYERPHGALALGIVAHAVDRRGDGGALAGLRKRAVDVLRSGLSDTALAPGDRAAFAVALGMARDEAAGGALRDLVANPYEDGGLRANAALGLGLIGVPTRKGREVLKAAALAGAGTELHRNAVIALALLGDERHERPAESLQGRLVALLDRTSDPEARRKLVLLLGQVGTHRAVPPLVALLDDETADPALRAQAAAALGQLGDLEMPASLDLLRHDTNYRAWSDLIVLLADLL